MRADRLLSILLLLHVQRRITAGELAKFALGFGREAEVLDPESSRSRWPLEHKAF